MQELRPSLKECVNVGKAELKEHIFMNRIKRAKAQNSIMTVIFYAIAVFFLFF